MWDFPNTPIRPGDTLILDGVRYEVGERVRDTSGCGRFLVENGGETEEKHLDWFFEESAEADDVRIVRGETS